MGQFWGQISYLHQSVITCRLKKCVRKFLARAIVNTDSLQLSVHCLYYENPPLQIYAQGTTNVLAKLVYAWNVSTQGARCPDFSGTVAYVHLWVTRTISAVVSYSSLCVAGAMHSVLIKRGVFISVVVWYSSLYVAGAMHSALNKGGCLRFRG